MSPLSRLTLGRTSSGYLIRLEGKATLFQSTSFQELVDLCLVDPPPSDVVADLSACEYLDSTFLGCLVGIHRRCNEEHRTRLSFYAPAGVSYDLLHRSRLDRLLVFVTELPRLIDEPVEVELGDPNHAALGEHVSAAHRHLAELGGPDSTAFERIARHIATELGQD